MKKDFVKLVRGGNSGQGLTTASTSVQSHLMAFAAEKLREEHRVIELKEFEESLQQS
ncbi:hypothetical protein MUG84_11050 [Paenibacillus sp. KQZ6P-2]|uniref:Uncharacterized protein n=1 Tax=Paenibacillus mangrovi TaxID=2931978 RepID=A0A9X2B2T2_9BACL|nr:hypothetical protein [Paenibacillus mangrovi]MCJ8012270.1 hypothetical protein [Paenibacillus mangrovi]